MLFKPYVRFHFFYLSGRLLGNSCSLGLRYVFEVKVPYYQGANVFFFHLIGANQLLILMGCTQFYR